MFECFQFAVIVSVSLSLWGDKMHGQTGGYGKRFCNLRLDHVVAALLCCSPAKDSTEVLHGGFISQIQSVLLFFIKVTT